MAKIKFNNILFTSRMHLASHNFIYHFQNLVLGICGFIKWYEAISLKLF